MIKELIKRITNKLDEYDIKYMIIGGQAVILYGETRLTKDIDIIIGVDSSKAEVIIKLLEELNLKILVDNPLEFIKKTMVIPAIDEQSGIRIDMIFSYSEYEKVAINRVKKVEIDGNLINYISVEDLIIHKIISGRARDLEDIKNIILKNQDIDEKYIEYWLEEFEKIMEDSFIKKFNEIKDNIKDL